MKILVVDDDKISCLLHVSMITSMGYKCVAAHDGDEAIVALNDQMDIGVVVSDWMMPGMDGIELCRRIREKEGAGYIYVVMLTAKNKKEDFLEGFKAGVDAYLQKPPEPDSLEAQIKVGIRIVNLERRLTAEKDKVSRFANEMETLADERAKQLVHADRMVSLGTMSAGIAHEINNPTTFINVNASTMDKWWKLLSPLFEKMRTIDLGQELEANQLYKMIEKFPDMIQSIKKGTERITRITNSLRSFARTDHAERQKIDVEKAIENALVIAKNQYKYHSDITVDNQAETTDVLGNSQQIEQVFINLIVNAADAIREKSNAVATTEQAYIGHISILLQESKNDTNAMEIIVRDNGIGMDSDVEEKIFNPFFTTKPLDKGTGLGMSIVYGIVNDHEGRISVESQKGEGSTFTIRLPKYRMPE